MRLLIKSFLAIILFSLVDYYVTNIKYSEPWLYTIIPYIIVYFLCFGLFYIAKRIYYGKDKCKNFVFNSIIPVFVLSIILKMLLMVSLRVLVANNYDNADIYTYVISTILGIYAYVIVLTLLARLIFKGFVVNYPIKNNFLTRLLKVLHIACLVADLTIIGAFFGIPIFLALWIFQYIFANEKNPFFVFRKYNPKSYQEEEIINVEVEDEKPKKSLKTFLENWKD